MPGSPSPPALCAVSGAHPDVLFDLFQPVFAECLHGARVRTAHKQQALSIHMPVRCMSPENSLPYLPRLNFPLLDKLIIIILLCFFV